MEIEVEPIQQPLPKPKHVSALAVASLILGSGVILVPLIIALATARDKSELFVCWFWWTAWGGWIIGIPAAIVGAIAVSKIRNSRGQLGGSHLAIAGFVLGWSSIALAIWWWRTLSQIKD